MKNPLRIRFAALFGATALLLSACGVRITSANLQETATLIKGESQSLGITYGSSQDADEQAIQQAADKLDTIWSTSDETVATVDETGLVSAVGAGTAEITMTAKDGEITDTCTVTVVVPAEGVQVPDTLALVVNGTNSQVLGAKATPEDATGITLTYESSNPAVATVDANGIVTAVANGEADITTTMTQVLTATSESATAEDAVEPEVFTAVTHVTVTTNVESITLDNTEGILTVGNTHTIKATVTPDSVSNAAVAWASSDESVATVDDEGNVKAVGTGTATITASAGDVSADYELTVRNITCSYCRATGHTSSNCPVKAADQKAAAQAAAEAAAQQQAAAAAAAQQQAAAQASGGGSTSTGGSSGGGTSAPAPAPDPGPSGGESSGGGYPDDYYEQGQGGSLGGTVVTGGGNGVGVDAP